VHHVTHVTVLGVRFRPMAKAKLVVVFDLVGKVCHPGVFRKLFLVVEVEPRVPCVHVLGLILILVGEEFDGSTLLN